VEPLFSYGTLQYPAVQEEQFGRLLDGTPDTLSGFRVGRIAISDPEVVRQSGASHHPALVASGDANDQIAGVLFELTGGELAAADDYEAADYVRTRVTLESGREAWIYVAAPGVQVE
jgi:hypothetical protein